MLHVQLYRFRIQRTNNNFNVVILKRLFMSKKDKIVVVVRMVIDDIRVYKVQTLKIIALKFTERSHARIDKVSGECLTLDQLALRVPLGQNTDGLPMSTDGGANHSNNEEDLPLGVDLDMVELEGRIVTKAIIKNIKQ
ncbi:60S ribosomal protein L18-2 [Glycine max]|nr:60S ribosomal protein L18-2 [Glycine max]